MQILDYISYPHDIKALDYDNLKQLSCEIRKLVIKQVTENGGHLASNLGVFELTILIHLGGLGASVVQLLQNDNILNIKTKQLGIPKDAYLDLLALVQPIHSLKYQKRKVQQ